MDKRTIIAFVLSMLVILGYQYFYVRNLPKKPQALPAAIENSTAAVGGVSAPQEAASSVSPTHAAPLANTPASFVERTVTVETDLFRAEFSTTGGTVKNWELKHFRDNRDKKDKPVRLLDANAQGPYRALAIGIQDDYSLSSAAFALVEGGDMTLDSANPSGAFVFMYTGSDRSIRRTYTFSHDTYFFKLKDEVAGIPEYNITLGSRFGIFHPEGTLTHFGPVLLKESDRIELTAKKLDETRLYAEGLKWIALEDKYFTSAIVPAPGMDEARVWAKDGEAVIALRGKLGVNELTVYAGPKDHDRLKGLGVGLEHIVDFGFFSPVARPIFWLLKQFYAMTGNYGWAIVVLTIVVRIPFIPIVNRGQRSMKKLQELQPRVQELREKHKKDPQKMNEEMMGLYKKHKVNPLGGCLPLLLQFPVFLALYKVLLVAIELRQAPWALWIVDLSEKDPYYVLPIVMGVTMVIQQKMTPSTADDMQKKIMMAMPIIFTFMFLNFASGLVLYWLVNNVLSIGQQLYVNLKDKQTS